MQRLSIDPLIISLYNDDTVNGGCSLQAPDTNAYHQNGSADLMVDGRKGGKEKKMNEMIPFRDP